MASMDSSVASRMKLQVFTIITSAWVSSGVMMWSLLDRRPSMTSESTRFLGHPRLVTCTLFPMLHPLLEYTIIAEKPPY